jgi:predicted nucleotidyltransferase
MMDIIARLKHLSQSERNALSELVSKLKSNFSQSVMVVFLYGSGVRGDRGIDSDVDLLIITRRDDWREHEPIRFLAARLSNEYDVFLSPRVMGLSRFEVLEKVQPLCYRNIIDEGIELLRFGSPVEVAEKRKV